MALCRVTRMENADDIDTMMNRWINCRRLVRLSSVSVRRALLGSPELSIGIGANGLGYAFCQALGGTMDGLAWQVGVRRTTLIPLVWAMSTIPATFSLYALRTFSS
jgi:hypothetical protein